MSKLLAPIHYWLYGKVQIMEDIEKSILAQVEDLAVLDYAQGLQSEIADYINDTPLEAVIDQGNIHGWLQDKITITETRQAKLIDFMMATLSPEKTHEVVVSAYSQEGADLGRYKADNELNTAPDLFKALGDVLLEGMPCDRVNVITANTASALDWDVVACVHENYWNQSTLKVTDYYAYRAAFTKAFIENANPEYTYSFNNDNGQKHKIFKV